MSAELSSALDYALRYPAFGWPVFPCRPGEKRPLVDRGLHAATPDEATIGQLWGDHPRANIGVPCGAQFWVLDIDKKSGGHESLASLEEKHGGLPATLMATTPSGGFHFFFAPHPDIRNSASKIAPGIDVRGHGGYVCVEGSVVEGKSYAFQDWDPLTDEAPILAPAPQWLLDLACGKASPKAFPANGGNAQDGNIPEGGRNQTLASMAGAMRRRGMADEAILAALRVENTTRCNPPLSDSEVATIARSVSRYAPAQPATENKGAAWPATLDLADLATHDPEPPRFIVPDWLPSGYATLFAGHGGMGKSALALLLAVCMALGLAFAGIEVARRRVLYLSCEDRAGILHWRLDRICRNLRINLADLAGRLDIVELVGRDSILWERDPRTGYTVTPAYGQLAERVRDSSTEVLMVDGVSDTFAGNENARGEVKRYVNALVALIPPDTGSVLLIGHVAKPTATNAQAGEGYSGSTQWHNAVRARWYLYPETAQGEDNDRAERTGRLLLELQKSNMGRTDQSIPWRWDDDAHLFLPESAPTAFDRKHQQREEERGILLALRGCTVASIVVPAAMQGPRTAYHVLRQRPEFPESLRSGRASVRRFWREIEALRQIRHVEECEYRRTNAHKGLALILTTEGDRHIAT